MITHSRTLRVASVQFESKPNDTEANVITMQRFVEEAAAQGVRLIQFPECCITGYWFIRNLSIGQLDTLSESIPDGPSVQRLRGLAHDHRLTVGAGLIER